MNLQEFLESLDNKKKRNGDKKFILASESDISDKKILENYRRNNNTQTYKNKAVDNYTFKVIGELVYRALPLDESFKSEFKSAIFDRTRELVREFASNLDSTESMFINVVRDIAYNEACMVIKESVNPDDNVEKETAIRKIDNADITKDDVLDAATTVTKLNGDSIADIVASKTMDVIEAEKKVSDAQIAAMDDINSKYAPEVDKEEDEEGQDTDDNQEPDNGESNNAEDNQNNDSNEEDFNVEESSLFGTLLKKHTLDSIKEHGRVVESTLAEAILDYSILETMNTIKLIKMNENSVLKIKNTMFNK